MRSAAASVVPGGMKVEVQPYGACPTAVLSATVWLRGEVVASGEGVAPLELAMEVELWRPERPTTPGRHGFGPAVGR